MGIKMRQYGPSEGPPELGLRAEVVTGTLATAPISSPERTLVRRLIWILAGFLIALVAGVVVASRNDAAARSDVRSVLATSRTSGLVRLQGNVHALGTNRLVLKDATGEIHLSTCPAWYRRLSFGSRERVRVLGHLAPRQLWRANRPTFVVYRIEGDYGMRLTLRQNDGVPVWHRYRDYPGRWLQWEISRELASAS